VNPLEPSTTTNYNIGKQLYGGQLDEEVEELLKAEFFVKLE
jgi:hypothetical protein